MSGVIAVLIFLSIFGFVPLLIVLYKRKRVRKLIATGISVTATVYKIDSSPRYNSDAVLFHFRSKDNRPHTGKLTSPTGRYRRGEHLTVYYDPANPQRNTVKGAWESKPLLIFVILIAAFVLFAVWKLYEGVKEGVF